MSSKKSHFELIYPLRDIDTTVQLMNIFFFKNFEYHKKE